MLALPQFPLAIHSYLFKYPDITFSEELNNNDLSLNKDKNKLANLIRSQSHKARETQTLREYSHNSLNSRLVTVHSSFPALNSSLPRPSELVQSLKFALALSRHSNLLG
mmetsp:Transcript_3634/g.7971  ORF Transcript_3634/g.7971 Transcript_3634/m.7971 type:complete len:109 (+) Transcript_3634:814-1140(+)